MSRLLNLPRLLVPPPPTPEEMADAAWMAEEKRKHEAAAQKRRKRRAEVEIMLQHFGDWWHWNSTAKLWQSRSGECVWGDGGQTGWGRKVYKQYPAPHWKNAGIQWGDKKHTRVVIQNCRGKEVDRLRVYRDRGRIVRVGDVMVGHDAEGEPMFCWIWR